MTTQKKVVPDEQLGKLARRQNALFQRTRRGNLDPELVCQELQGLIEMQSENWIETFLVRELRYHWRFFGMSFGLSKLAIALQKYGLNQIRKWKSLGLEIHFLPKLAILDDSELPGLKIKPSKEYFDLRSRGQILRKNSDGEKSVTSFGLDGITVLIDTRLRPMLRPTGNQMFKNDNLLGEIIERLRQDTKIKWLGSEGIPIDSRFGISVDEWEKSVKPKLAKLLEVEVSQVRLERVIEANVIPQLFPHMPRKDDLKTADFTFVWLEEYWQSSDDHLCSSGLMLKNLDPAVNNKHTAIRPLIILD